jgi:hypothetical protein
MRKGQTALEYLMTYGWAILIVIVVVGALYALGLTKPCRWTGTQVREFADFQVSTPKMDTSTPQSLSFSLAYLKPDTIANATIIATIGTQSSSPDVVLSLPATVELTGFSGIASGDCYTANVSIVYNITGSTVYNLKSVGVISGVAS